MPWTYFSNMNDADLGAIYDYLQSLPKKPNVDQLKKQAQELHQSV